MEAQESLEQETPPPDDPIRMFAKQLMGTAIRPRLPEPNVIERAAAEPRVIRPQQSVTSVTADKVLKRAEVVTRTVDDDDEPRAPRIHTISKDYLDDGDDV
jgi:hypothetical protein